MSAYSSKPNGIGEPFIILPSVESTNNYAMAALHAGLAKHGTVYFAMEQTAGKGQRGKEWKSSIGENIMLTVVIQPDGIQRDLQFMLSVAISLSCYDFIKMATGLPLAIKWPNDLYINDRKAGGILIENILRGEQWMYALVGIGINVNQTLFDPELKSATSLKLQSQTNYELLDLVKTLLVAIEKRYRQFELNPEELIEEYNRELYKRNEVVRFRKKQNGEFSARIMGVAVSGELITDLGQLQHGEQEWILE